MMGWQWHLLDHMQIICTSLQTDNHASTSPLSFFPGQMPFLPPNQLRQSIEGAHNRTYSVTVSTAQIPFLPTSQQCHSKEGNLKH